MAGAVVSAGCHGGREQWLRGAKRQDILLVKRQRLLVAKRREVAEQVRRAIAIAEGAAPPDSVSAPEKAQHRTRKRRAGAGLCAGETRRGGVVSDTCRSLA